MTTLWMEPATIDALIDQAYAIRGTDINKSILLTQEALQHCLETDYKLGKSRAENQLGLFHLVQGDFDKATEFTESALKYCTEHNDVKGIADAQYNLGSIYYRTDNYHKGLQSMLKCLQIYRDLDDLHNQARALKSIGTIYEYFGDHENASASYYQCIEIARQIKDLNLESNAYNPLSGIYLKRNEVDKAFDLIQRSIAIKTETRDYRGLAFARYARGKVYLRKKDYESALEDFNEALALTLRSSDKLGQAMVYNKMGFTHFEMGDHEKARECLLTSEKISKEFKVSFILFRVYRHLYLLTKSEGKHEEALKYLERSLEVKNDVVDKETFNIFKSYDAILKIESLEHETRLQKEKNAIIERKNAELDSFFYRVSHDLKGPISSLLGLHHLAQMEIEDPVALKFVDQFQNQALRMNNIVMGLINLTEIKNTGKLKVKIDFDRLVDECINSCHYLDQDGKVTITKKIEAIEFQSEWAIVNSILQNLIENAIKYSRKDITPFVNISIRQLANKVVIRVEDNGEGISQHHQGNVFDMFYRANDKTKGSGLGLYILKRAVERLHGTVELQSTVGSGSVFTVTLPLNG